MPLPTPNPGESQQDFISRCEESLAGEFPDNEQRTAVCFNQWESGNQARAEIHLDGVISSSGIGGTISPADVRAQLKEASGKPVTVVLDSEGGEVFAGVSIFEALKRHESGVNVRIDGLAGSIASYIAMAGNTITIADGGFMMTHGAWKVTMGDAGEHREAADLLESITSRITDAYAQRAGISHAEAMDRFVDGENWFDAEQAIEAGLADSKSNSHAVNVRVSDPSIYHNLPAALVREIPRPRSQLESQVLVSTVQGKSRALS